VLVERRAPERREPEPVAQVTIGRLDVRAVVPPAKPSAERRQPSRHRAISLEEYLDGRQGGRR
jgi:hypothetical protein